MPTIHEDIQSLFNRIAELQRAGKASEARGLLQTVEYFIVMAHTQQVCLETDGVEQAAG